MKYLTSVICWFLINSTMAQKGSTGMFQNSIDIGNPKNAGSSFYNNADQSYSIKGSGYNIWFARDEFHYLFNTIEGDFIMTANFRFAGKGANTHRKTGWMIRGSEKEDASHISATIHGDGLTMLQWRSADGAEMRDPEDQIAATGKTYDVIQIERAGKTITMRAAQNGRPFEVIGSHEMENLSGKVLAGLFICSHDPEVIEEARVWNVRIDK